MNRLLRTPITEQARKARAVLRPFQEFLQAETSSGLLLVVCTVIAFAWANSPWAAGYEALLEVHLTIGIAGFLLDHPLHVWINDGLMTIFFLLVGLELKREFMVGELSAPRQALLPIIAAAGGALCPALIYSMLNFNTAGAKGWGIPMATDIAFALGILLLVGRQLPESLRVFLSALAIADDLIAVLVIALFYTQNVNFLALGIAAGSVCYLFLLNRMRVRYLAPYVLGGLLLWGALFHSGVHATIAGVLLAFLLPGHPQRDLSTFVAEGQTLLARIEQTPSQGQEPLLSEGHQHVLRALETVCEEVQTPLQRLEHALQHWVPFAILPLFVLTNAGIHLEGSVGQLISPVSLGVVLGLLIGKPVGILLSCRIASIGGWLRLPTGVTWCHLAGMAILAGIGFTMSLFVANLAFETAGEVVLLKQAKIGILVAALIAASGGALALQLEKVLCRARRAETAASLAETESTH